ncbi:MAG: SpoIIE family protein phosphatase [Halobacteriovoraceae bacterium]|nr:SpoIIE family protein phosphatase [Halobacteriovoraceae bacterium]
MLTIILLVQFASNLFNEDKSATIYEATLNTSLGYAERVRNYIEQTNATVELLEEFSGEKSINANSLKNIFSKNPHFISFSLWEEKRTDLNNFKVYLENDLYLRQHSIKGRSFLNQDKKEIQKLSPGYTLVKNDGERAEIVFKKRTKESTLLARMSLESLLRELNQETQFQSFLIFGKQVFSTKLNSKNDIRAKLESYIQKEPEVEHKGQVIKWETPESNYLISIQKVNNQLSTVSLIEESSIFRASAFLRKQSLFFGLLIFSLTVIFGVLISKGMTSGLSRLHEATLSYAKGKFENDFEVKSKDEIGSLAVTFKKMGKEILRYIEEMKDKARLEKEIEVARLVQESFIPQENRTHNNLKLSSIVQSASECGGDWWGLLELEDKWILVVADATGHGVPAALLTATAGGCLHNIEYSLKKSLQKEIYPSEILKELNFSIARMGGKINMTAFALVIDSKTGIGKYSNASHNPPILIKEGLSDKDFSKNDLQPLMGDTGSRLGESLESVYTDSEINFKQEDFLFLFSDGLVEQENKEGKQWGNRKFYKELVNQLNLNKGAGQLQALPQGLINEVKKFSEDRPWDDDVTLITLGFTSEQFTEDPYSKMVVSPETLLSQGIENDKVYSELLQNFNLKFIFQKEEDLELKEKIKEKGLYLESVDLEYQSIVKLEFLSNENLEQRLQEGIEKLNFDGFFDSPREPFSIIARELVSNALYHQAEDTSSLDRTSHLTLNTEKGVSVQLGQGEKGLAVLVNDQSGRLNYKNFQKALTRAYREKTPNKDIGSGGAGLGLLMIFENANRVFIDVEPGKGTKILAIIEKEKRYKKYKAKNTDFIFIERFM